MDDSCDSIERILQKLPIARSSDPGFDEFGSSGHHYLLHPPIGVEVVADFEARHAITLPHGYRQFVLGVGDGGPGYNGSGAGPFYGIYPLGTGASEIFGDQPRAGLASPCVVSPRMSIEAWTTLTSSLGLGGDLDGDAYEKAISTLFGGLLPIGSQGCSNLHCLVVTGPFTGRVVNVDLELSRPPLFAYEADFLAWYERWLDEVIAGDLREQPAWFGYVRGGPEAELLAGYLASADLQAGQEYLDGLNHKRQLAAATLGELVQLRPESMPHRASLCRIVTKSNYAMAKPLLLELGKRDPLSFFQCLHWHATDKVPEWEELILSHASRIADDKTFRFFTYLLERLDVDRGAYLALFTRSDQAAIRTTAFYALGKIGNRKDYVDCFIEGLKDADITVVRNTLQALAGLKDPTLVPYYRLLAERFPEERDYVLINLDRRFAEFGLSRRNPQRGEGARSVASRIAANWRNWMGPKGSH